MSVRIYLLSCLMFYKHNRRKAEIVHLLLLKQALSHYLEGSGGVSSSFTFVLLQSSVDILLLHVTPRTSLIHYNFPKCCDFECLNDKFAVIQRAYTRCFQLEECSTCYLVLVMLLFSCLLCLAFRGPMGCLMLAISCFKQCIGFMKPSLWGRKLALVSCFVCSFFMLFSSIFISTIGCCVACLLSSPFSQLAMQVLVAAALRATCIFVPFMAFQAFGYYNLCFGRLPDELRPWCNRNLAIMYNYIQNKYWYVPCFTITVAPSF